MVDQSMKEWYQGISSNGEGIVLLHLNLMPDIAVSAANESQALQIEEIARCLDSEIFMSSPSHVGAYNARSRRINQMASRVRRGSQEKKDLDRIVQARDFFASNLGLVERNIAPETRDFYGKIRDKIRSHVKKVRGYDIEMESDIECISYALCLAKDGEKTILCAERGPTTEFAFYILGDPRSPVYSFVRDEDTIRDVKIMNVEKEKRWKSVTRGVERIRDLVAGKDFTLI